MTPLRRGTPRIARRLTWVTATASITSLLFAGLILVAYDYRTFENTMRIQRAIQARIIGANTATELVNDDAASAEATLATLRTAPRIEAAGVYTSTGRLFASYMREPGLAPLALPDVPASEDEWYAVDERFMHIVYRMDLDGRPLGVVYIRSDLLDVRERLAGYLGTLAAVLLVSLMAAQLVSRLSRRAIAEPIVAMADTARRLAADRDYSVRVTASAPDELGVLVTAFNEMLAQIQDRDRSLRESHDLLEQRVRDRTAALNESNRELEAFCYSVSHDLRSPLRGIDGFSAALLEDLDGQLDESSARHLTRIRAATQRMGILIDDLLNLARLSRSDMKVTTVDLSALCHDVVADLRAVQPARSLEVVIAGDLRAAGDPRLIRQLLDNLIGNAWKFTSRRTDAEIEVGARAAAEGTVFFVRDNGAGFDPAYSDRLFAVFQRLHATTDFPGTGVGLAIVERIVRRHGGRVWAEGAEGQGATFFFTLAPHPAPAVEAAPATARSASG